VYSRAAYFVDRIFKGEKPPDLSVEQVTKLELLLYLKIAKAIGIELPATVLVRAEELIE
jgi:putative tryptophan/tyrosine transport system substrate-binding protein